MAAFSHLRPIHRLVSCTPGSSSFPPTVAVFATAAGTIDVVDGDGNTVAAVPVAVGLNWLTVTKISAATATGLFLGY